MTRLISKTFRCLKHNRTQHSKASPSLSKYTSASSASSSSSSSSSTSSWSAYLILSTNKPIKTYVGVTNDFSRRLKQHNGELKGGAKASRAGRPWICACIIHGFKDQSEACALETKWKSCSRKLSRKRKNNGIEQEHNRALDLLQHRQAALTKIRASFDFSHLEVDWKLDPS